MLTWERDRHIVGRCYPYGIVDQSRLAEALNCASVEVEHNTRRKGLLRVRRRRVGRRPLTCERERRWLRLRTCGEGPCERQRPYHESRCRHRLSQRISRSWG